MKHTAYFGDGEKTFALTYEMILELQDKTGNGIGAIYGRFMASQFHYNDIIEIIRLGLIGGETAPEDAQRLINTYAKARPIMETLPLAFDILDIAWNGKQDEPQVETEQAAEAYTMTDAFNGALEQVAP